MGKIMGEALVRGREREWERQKQALMLYCHLISLELRMYLSGPHDE